MIRSNVNALTPRMLRPVRRMISTRDADEAADHAADPAEQRGAADHRAGDGEKHQVGAALERHDRRHARRVEDPREAGEHVREDEVADLDPADVDAVLGRADDVSARGEGPESPARPGEDRLHEQDEPERPEELGVEEELVVLRLRAEDVLERLAARHELLRPFGQVQRDAVQEEEHPERRDEGRNAEVGRDHPVHEPDGGGKEERGDHAEPDREVVLVRVAEDPDDRRGQGVDAADRKVDLAADQEHHLTGRDQRDRGHRLGDVLDVVALEEDGVLRPEEDRQRDGDGEDARLAAPEKRAGDAPAEAGASHFRRWTSATGSAAGDRVLLRFDEEPSYRVFVVR